MRWNPSDLPSLAGKRAIITGATGGLGLETAVALAGAGADVLLTGRNEDKGRQALQRVRAAHPSAAIEYAHLDVSSLASVRTFADDQLSENKTLHILVNNAGVMAPTRRKTSVDGFELQLATNYLGHFALTAHLLPLLRRAEGARTVQLSSLAHNFGRINFDDIQAEKGYSAWPAYGQSKLAMLMFALELQRRSDAQGWGLISLAAHPGWSRTDLVANGPGKGGFFGVIAAAFTPFLSQSAADGALPQIFAAAAPRVLSGRYYGPDGFLELKGGPGLARMTARAQSRDLGARLWDVSERIAGVRW